MNNIEILRSGFSDSLDILKTEEMDFICGGDTDCKKNYSLSNYFQSVVEVVLLTVRKEKIKDKKATAPYIKNILKRCYL